MGLPIEAWTEMVGGGEEATMIAWNGQLIVIAFDLVGVYRDAEHYWACADDDLGEDPPLALTEVDATPGKEDEG